MADNTFMGTASCNSWTHFNRSILVALRVELNLGKCSPWCANFCMATLCGGEDECNAAGGGSRVAVKPVLEPGKKVIGRREIERVVRLIMEGEEGRKMRRKAKELKEIAQEALSPGGSSYNVLPGIVEFWKSLC